MRTKLLFMVSSVVLLGLVLGGAAFGSGSASITREENLRTNARFTNFHFVDNTPANHGEGTGDEILFRVKLSQGGSRIGTGLIECTAMFFRQLACATTMQIEGRGKLVAEGSFAERQRIHASLAVTGGTGDFRNARGTVEVDDTGPNSSSFDFHLIP
jgi:hypothetical protein